MPNLKKNKKKKNSLAFSYTFIFIFYIHVISLTHINSPVTYYINIYFNTHMHVIFFLFVFTCMCFVQCM